MFGVLRTTLALMVMIYHLFLGIRPLGMYPVFGFYIISGYLMTLIMHESYGYTLVGRYSFTTNRFLRLYPQYWCAALLSICLVIWLGSDVTTGFHNSIFVPIAFKNVLQNIFMTFISWFPNSVTPRLVPPTWALTVEIFFYILICMGISKTIFRVKIWLFLSVCYVLVSYMTGWAWNARYFPVAAASLPFSIGSAIYFASKSELLMQLFVKFRLSSKLLFVLMLLNCLTWIIVYKMKVGKLEEIGLYLNIVICALLVFSLANGREIFNINRKTDKIIGDYSYPIYLLHWQIGLLASYLIFGEAFYGFSIRGFVSLVATFLIVLLISTLLIRGIDERVQRLRTKIKANKALQRTFVPRPAEL